MQYCTVNEVTRVISIPDELKVLGVENDRNSNRLYFRVKRNVTNDFDLLNSTVYINFMNANGQKGQYVASDLADNGENVTFSWLIAPEVVSYKGDVKFIICAKRITGEYLTSEWNTTLATCNVLVGLEPDGTVPITPSEQDVVSQLIQNVNQLKLSYDEFIKGEEGINNQLEAIRNDILAIKEKVGL